MSTPEPARFYYLNDETKEIRYFAEQQSPVPEGHRYAGMSELPIKGAAGYYAKNQSGYTLINGDEEAKETQVHVEESETAGTDVPAD